MDTEWVLRIDYMIHWVCNEWVLILWPTEWVLCIDSMINRVDTEWVLILWSTEWVLCIDSVINWVGTEWVLILWSTGWVVSIDSLILSVGTEWILIPSSTEWVFREYWFYDSLRWYWMRIEFVVTLKQLFSPRNHVTSLRVHARGHRVTAPSLPSSADWRFHYHVTRTNSASNLPLPRNSPENV